MIQLGDTCREQKALLYLWQQVVPCDSKFSPCRGASVNKNSQEPEAQVLRNGQAMCHAQELPGAWVGWENPKECLIPASLLGRAIEQ